MNYHHYPNHKSKGFTGWWNPNHTTTIPQEVSRSGQEDKEVDY